MVQQFLPYRDRNDAGQKLAPHLAGYAGREDVIVLGLARGGLPVAQAIAQTLHLSLDVFLVRKLGAPGREELAFGAIAGDVRLLNQDVVSRLGLSQTTIEATTARERAEMARRNALYRGDRAPLDVRGETAILVDDGLATGASMRVAVTVLRRLEPERIVVAVPVAAESSVGSIRALADEFICPLVPPLLFGIGAWYQDFSQVSDAQVQAILDDALRD